MVCFARNIILLNSCRYNFQYIGWIYVAEEPPKELVRSGIISAKARDYGASLIKPGTSCREICEAVERYIVELGAQPAFPCNISINEIAAHYTPGLKDDCTIPNKGVVKLDVGASIDGYITDTAVSVALDRSSERLVEAAERALESVVEAIKPGIRVYDIGRIIESTVRKMGFKPIRNLSGHSIGRFVIHAGLTIPNYADRTSWLRRLEPGLVVAIEPFVTKGRGLVVEGKIANIYAVKGKRPTMPLPPLDERLLAEASRRFKTMPFTLRWLRGLASDEELEASAVRLVASKMLHAYPILIEVSRSIVAQAEHTFYVGRKEVIVLTLSEAR